MKLMTKEIERKLPKLYGTEETPLEEKQVIVKYFTPDANWTWYVVEGEKTEDGDFDFFGLVDGFEKEWGYFTLKQLEEVKGALGLPIERDLHFEGKIKEIKGGM